MFSYEPIKRKKDVLVTPHGRNIFLNSGENMASKWILKLQFYNYILLMGKKWDETSYIQLYCSCTRIDQRKRKVMVQQEGKAKKPVLPDSNEKEDNLLSGVEHFDCSSSTRIWWTY